jgi:hypothetical protein
MSLPMAKLHVGVFGLLADAISSHAVVRCCTTIHASAFKSICIWMLHLQRVLQPGYADHPFN